MVYEDLYTKADFGFDMVFGAPIQIVMFQSFDSVHGQRAYQIVVLVSGYACATAILCHSIQISTTEKTTGTQRQYNVSWLQFDGLYSLRSYDTNSCELQETIVPILV